MKTACRFLAALTCLAPMLGASVLAEKAPKALLEMKAGVESRLTPSSGQVVASPGTENGVVVTIQPGREEYPGIAIKPPSGSVLDLSQWGHIEARVVNLGEKPLGLNLRIDNAGGNDAEIAYLKPGATATLKTIFGYAYGRKPAYRLKPEAVTQILIFATKSAAVQSFRIESLVAAGPAGEQPPIDPQSIRVKPENGLLFGHSVKVNPAQITVQNGAESSLLGESGAWKIGFSGQGQSVRIKLPQGKWDLRDATQVRVKVKNTGEAAASLAARVESDPGSTETVAAAPLAPGAAGEIVISFIPPTPWTGIKDSARTEWSGTKGFGTQFTSDAVTAVTVASGDAAGAHSSFEVQSIVAEAPPVVLPDWLGQRPPVEGEWTKTFDEEFNGHEIDLTKWNVYTANYWDKTSHFSKANVIVENGLAKLRYEKKRGRHNDDPNGKETDYATGFLDTHGKWVQRYGYFEARMKLPKAPGLWPAMWLMPDRGLHSGAPGRRSSTGEGAMEFDVMEFLSRWGGHRFNIAFHWDGYEKEHKQTGSTTMYTGVDKDGFITCGLLWTPGQAVIYCNGSVVARWESPRISNVPSDLMFTNVMGGWDNNDLDDAQLPDEFVIDYVRCWQRKDLASEADGVKSTESTPSAPVKER